MPSWLVSTGVLYESTHESTRIFILDVATKRAITWAQICSKKGLSLGFPTFQKSGFVSLHPRAFDPAPFRGSPYLEDHPSYVQWLGF